MALIGNTGKFQHVFPSKKSCAKQCFSETHAGLNKHDGFVALLGDRDINCHTQPQGGLVTQEPGEVTRFSSKTTAFWEPDFGFEWYGRITCLGWGKIQSITIYCWELQVGPDFLFNNFFWFFYDFFRFIIYDLAFVFWIFFDFFQFFMIFFMIFYDFFMIFFMIFYDFFMFFFMIFYDFLWFLMLFIFFMMFFVIF